MALKALETPNSLATLMFRPTVDTKKQTDAINVSFRLLFAAVALVVRPTGLCNSCRSISNQ